MSGIGRVTGLVLAGGQGTRMGSVDKGLQTFRGEPLVAHVLRRLVPQVATVLVSANRHPDRYASFGHRVVADVVRGRAGPLAGLHAGLAACTTTFLCAVPCDAPFVPLDLVARLARALDDDTALAVARTDARLHPVFCLMRRTVADDLEAYLAGGGRAAHRWIEGLAHRAVSFDDEQAFFNINTLDQLHEAGGDAPGAR